MQCSAVLRCAVSGLPVLLQEAVLKQHRQHCEQQQEPPQPVDPQPGTAGPAKQLHKPKKGVLSRMHAEQAGIDVHGSSKLMSRPQAGQSDIVVEVSSGSRCREFGQTQAVATHLNSRSEQQPHSKTDSQMRMERQTEHQSQRGACLDAADVVQTDQRVQEGSHTTAQTSVQPVGRGRQRIHLPRHDRLQQQQQQAGGSSTAAVNSCRHAPGQLQDVQVVSATQAEPATQAVPATEAEQSCGTVSVQSASNDQAAECAGAAGVQAPETMRPGCQQPPGLDDGLRQLAESQLHQQLAAQHAAQHAQQPHSQHARQQHARQQHAQQQHSQLAQQQHSQHAQQQRSQHAHQQQQQSQHAQQSQQAQQPAVQDLQSAAPQQQQPVREHHQQPAAATLPRTEAKGRARDQQPAVAPSQLDYTEAAGRERDQQQPIMPALASSSSACEPPGAYHRPVNWCFRVVGSVVNQSTASECTSSHFWFGRLACQHHPAVFGIAVQCACRLQYSAHASCYEASCVTHLALSHCNIQVCCVFCAIHRILRSCTGSGTRSSPEGQGSGLAAENSIKFRRRSKFEALKARREEARQKSEVCCCIVGSVCEAKIATRIGHAAAVRVSCKWHHNRKSRCHFTRTYVT